ncbi:MAG: hypothetical protein HY200_02795 [Nitrospirae bacterium]|nr:hypothetical protein [Nitrospirota bacterium]MBI3593865.1 hypothetical protein [Nitrospirota bacterium]
MGDLIKGDLVRHVRYGIGRVEEASGYGENQRCMVYFPKSDKETSVAREQIQTLSETESAAYEMVKLAIDEIRREELPQVELMDRWTGGEVILKPSQSGLESKKIPLDTFFHKIVMIRDRLRVMEQQINGHKVLSDSEKVQLQQYITRIYGSLTTFNILFKNKADHFIGQKGED